MRILWYKEVVSLKGQAKGEEIMKKKMTAVLMAAMLAAVLTACGNKEYLKDLDPENYVTLGEYKEIPSELTKPEVTEEDIDDYVEYLMAANVVYTPVEGRPAQLGDVANIDYEGKLDGVAFEGGTAEGADLELGSGSFIDGFEDGVVGMEIGETRDLELTFPEEYRNNEELAGKAVVFTVTLNGISQKEVPELTDEYVESLESELFTNVQEFRSYMGESLKQQMEEELKTQKMDVALAALEEATVFKEAPKAMVERMAATMKSNFEQYAQSYGITVAEYVSYMYGWSADTYEEDVQEQAALMAQRYIMLAAVADKEGISVTDEEADTQIAEEASYYGLSVEEYTEDMDLESYKEYMLIQKVMEYLGDNVTVN